MLRQLLLDECVSAAELVRSIAEFVPAPDSFGRTEPQALRHNIDFHLWQGMARRACREAEAGAQVDALLINAKRRAPDWFAWGGPTGLPKVSDEAKEDGHRILESLSNYRDRLLSAPDLNVNPFRWLETLPVKDERRGDSARMDQIGFIRNDIAAFLDTIGLPHSLHRGCKPTEDREDLSTDDEIGEFEDVGTTTLACELDEQKPDPATQAAQTGVPLLSSKPADVVESGQGQPRIGWADDPVANKINEAIRVARAGRPELVGVPLTNKLLFLETWEVLKGWGIDSARALPGSNPNFPIVGWDREPQDVLFDPALSRNRLNTKKLKKRLAYASQKPAPKEPAAAPAEPSPGLSLPGTSTGAQTSPKAPEAPKPPNSLAS